MNQTNTPTQHTAFMHCNVENQLQIAVCATESISSETTHAERLERQQQLAYAWAAGFLDGEGCVSLVRVRRTCGNRVNYRARVHIVQNCLETLNILRDRVGENCVLSQLLHRESYTRPIYQLIYDGIHCHRLLKKLRPYLVRKGAESDVIFEFYRDGQPTRHFGPKGVPADIWHLRERCYEALRCLK
jgi:hypothetical protein